MLSLAATFRASRVTGASDGSYHFNGVTGPDDENPDVNDGVCTNVAETTTLTDATHAARVLGITQPAAWAQIASRMARSAVARHGVTSCV